MNTNTSLRMAVALLLGTAMHGTMAASLSDPIKIASEEADFTDVKYVGTQTALAIDVPVISGRTIDSTSPYYVVVTLKGGATFGGGAVGLTCAYGGGAAVVAVADTPAASNGGTVAAFRLESAGAANLALTGSTCKLNFAAHASGALKLASGKKEYGIAVTARHLSPADQVSASQSGSLITFNQGLGLSVSAGAVTVDVTSPSLSKRFQLAGTVPAAGLGLTAALGKIKFVGLEGVITMSGTPIKGAAPALVGAVAKYITDVNVFVSGAPLSSVQTTAAAIIGKTGGIFIGADSTCAASAGGGGLRNSSGGQVSFQLTVAQFNLVNSTFAANKSGVTLCMNANGVSNIDRGAISFTMTPSPSGSAKPNMQIVDSTLIKVVKNGTSIKVLNIPNPENLTDQAFIRFYNMTSNSGKVFGTLYAQDGTVLGTPNSLLIDNMAANVVGVLDAPALATKFSITKNATTGQSWPGRAWLQIESEIKGLRVQALVRAGGIGGVLMNMGDRILTDDETTTHRPQ